MATADPAAMTESASAIYQFQGTLLEACNCNVLCPCWMGEDPDNGTCDSIIAYHIHRGQVSGVDVAGLTVVEAHHIPGNVLAAGHPRGRPGQPRSDSRARRRLPGSTR